MPNKERWPTRHEKCHLCGRKLGGHLPICSRCYKKHLVDGRAPEWLRFLVNDLQRENRDDRQEEAHTVSLDVIP